VPPPSPTIQMVVYGNLLLFFWPTNSPGFTLESSPTLYPAIWTTVSNAPVQIGNQFVVPVIRSEPSDYFRLRYP